MQQWQPDRVFDRVDFKGKKSAKPGQAEQKKAENRAEKKKSPQTEAAPKANVQSWAPPTIEQSVRNESSGNVMKARPAGMPKQLHQTKQNQPLVRQPSSAAKQPAAKDPAFDMTRKLLVESVLMFPQQAADVLRSWYWEKPGRQTPLRNIPPENRIFVVLKSLPSSSLETLYSYMTPVERKQMHEIRQKPHHVTAGEIIKVRQDFLDRITNAEQV